MEEKTKKSKKVQALLYSTFKGNQATCYDTLMEAVSIHQYVSHHQKQDPIFELTSMGCSLPKPIIG